MGLDAFPKLDTRTGVERMKYISGYRTGKKTMRILIEITDYDMLLFDDLAHCVCTEDKEDHPLEKKYQDMLMKTEKVLWRYYDYEAPKFKKYLGYEPIHKSDKYVVEFDRIKKLLTPKAYKEFEKFMQGGTCVEEGVYDWDFLAFVKEQERFD